MGLASVRAEDWLNLPLFVGQRSLSYQWELIDGSTGIRKGLLTPLRDNPPQLTHDTSATISRRLSNVVLGVQDAALIDPIADRIKLSMILGDRSRSSYPLGTYMICDEVQDVHSNGATMPLTFFDEMFIVDQQMETGFNGRGELADQAAARLLDGLPIGELIADATPQTVINSWGAGTSKAKALMDMASLGGYFKPWFNHANELRMIAAFEPADRLPDIDLDDPPRVYRDSIARSSDLLNAPNRFVRVSNDTGATGDGPAPAPVVGRYDVPATAPHSIARRGFVVPDVDEAQLSSSSQAAAYTRAIGIQQTVYEKVELVTPPDPRHDSYQVIRWDGELWLEIGWALTLSPGGAMKHTLRRAYPGTGEEQ